MTLPRNARGVLNGAFRHKWRFVGVFSGVVALALAVAVIVQPVYRSDALLLVKFNGRYAEADTVAGAAIQAQASERREVMNSQAQILRSHDLLLQAATAVGLERLYPDLAEDPEATGDIGRKAAEELDRDLEIEPTKDTNVMHISLLNRDPEIAAEALRVLIENFRVRQMEVFLNPQSEFLQDQLDEARRQLAASQAALEEFKTTAGISSLAEELTLLLRLRAEAQNNLSQQSARRGEADSRAQELADSLKHLAPTIQLSDENDRFKAIDDARARLTELRARESEMKSNYRDDSVSLRTLRSQIEFAEAEMTERSRESLARVRTGPNPVYQQVQADLLRAKAESAAASAAVEPLERQVAQVQERLANLDVNQGRLQDLSLQQQVDEENFRNVLQRVEDARASEQLQRQKVSSIVVVQQPTVPMTPARPRMLYIVALGALAGLALAFTVCVLWELSDERFSLPEQVTAVLKLPVLASFGDGESSQRQGAR
jgi:uncharacterized protein involved in exopolysaccharide biosynthesis